MLGILCTLTVHRGQSTVNHVICINAAYSPSMNHGWTCLGSFRNQMIQALLSVNVPIRGQSCTLGYCYCCMEYYFNIVLIIFTRLSRVTACRIMAIVLTFGEYRRTLRRPRQTLSAIIAPGTFLCIITGQPYSTCSGLI